MINRLLDRSLGFAMATVWLANGLFAKVLGYVPRHEEIVAGILGGEYAHLFTVAIGCGEIAIALAVIGGIWRRQIAVFQIALVAAMNVIEFFIVPDMLLFGRLNALIAAGFILLVYWHGFVLNRKSA